MNKKSIGSLRTMNKDELVGLIRDLDINIRYEVKEDIKKYIVSELRDNDMLVKDTKSDINKLRDIIKEDLKRHILKELSDYDKIVKEIKDKLYKDIESKVDEYAVSVGKKVDKYIKDSLPDICRSIVTVTLKDIINNKSNINVTIDGETNDIDIIELMRKIRNENKIRAAQSRL